MPFASPKSQKGRASDGAGDVVAQEAPHVEAKLHGQTGPRQIGHGALIVAVDTGRFGRAGRAARSMLGRGQIEDDSLGRGGERGKPELRRPR